MSTFCLDVFKFIKSTQPINKSRVQKNFLCYSFYSFKTFGGIPKAFQALPGPLKKFSNYIISRSNRTATDKLYTAYLYD